jgi:hypothetical protein
MTFLLVGERLQCGVGRRAVFGLKIFKKNYRAEDFVP